MSNNNLIDLDSSPPKLKVSFPLTPPLIPSPICGSTRSLSISSSHSITDDNNNIDENLEKSSNFIEEESNSDNNPFDVLMNKVVQYEQNQEDPYERVLESSKCLMRKLLDSPRSGISEGEDVLSAKMFGLRAPASNENDELISSIEMNFDELPSSEDDDSTEANTINDNLITLNNSSSKNVKSEEITEIKSEPIEENDNNYNEIEEELVDQESCCKKSTATTLLLSLKNLIKNDNNPQADKAIDDLRISLGLNLDNNSELIQVCLQNNDIKKDEHSNVQEKGDKNELFSCTLSKKHPNIEKCNVLNSTFEVSKSKVQLGTKTNLSNVKAMHKEVKKSPAQSNAKINVRETVKISPKVSATKSLSTVRKSPSLKLPSKSSDTHSLNRSLTLNQKLNNSKDKLHPNSSNVKGISPRTLQRAKPVDPKTKPKTSLNDTKTLNGDLAGRRTFTVSPSSSKVVRSQSAVSKPPAVSKEPNTPSLRRTSTTLYEKTKPDNVKVKSSSRINGTATLPKSQSGTSKVSKTQVDRENLNSKKTSQVPSKVKSKGELVKKPERRVALSPLENLNKITNKTTSTVLKKVVTIKKKISEQENRY